MSGPVLDPIEPAAFLTAVRLAFAVAVDDDRSGAAQLLDEIGDPDTARGVVRVLLSVVLAVGASRPPSEVESILSAMARQTMPDNVAEAMGS